MTRMSKQGQRRAVCPKKSKKPFPKTGSRQDNLPKGFREHENAVAGDMAQGVFIPKIA